MFGYSKLYGEVAGGQAEYLRVPQAQYTHIKVPDEGPDERYVYLSASTSSSSAITTSRTRCAVSRTAVVPTR